MPTRPKPRPSTGNERDYLAALLGRPAVWKLLLLWGTYRDDCDQDAIARRMLTVGVHVTGDQVTALYHLAIEHALRPMGRKSKKQAA
ncbi:unnamed protein product [Gemmata massiliana]|uniref:Uncharacterized protein n=1 Tax=Gemmata massiliana TaxID=1210884 RepID=A0A6P2D004_9BACT|nr:hypothetical protein [Gemmata massiliana]VTR92790.1 unnamed protein product [Gemmata massiliana]